MLQIVGLPRGSRQIGRRGFLSIGSLGLAGLSLEGLLRQREVHASPARSRSIILFFQAGGASHLDTLDMKPAMSEEIRGPFQPIETTVPGLSVCHLLPGLATVADQFSVIRSLHHHLSVHDDATHWVQTGYPLLNARQQGQQHPSQGSIVSALRGASQPGMPAYVCIPEDYRRHAGFY